MAIIDFLHLYFNIGAQSILVFVLTAFILDLLHVRTCCEFRGLENPTLSSLSLHSPAATFSGETPKIGEKWQKHQQA